jgi:hypothetical protein
MNAKIKRYVKERDEMLKKCDVAEFERFVEAHADVLPAAFLDRFRVAGPELKACILHKMIVNVSKLPKDLRDRSALWLVSRGYTLEI